jgi:ER degradation enhancer, mannosidase alpha-like 1
LQLGTAAAGSLILEFATLSRLTGDDRFEKAASKAFFALWNRRSDIGLLGNTINAGTGVCFFVSVAFLPDSVCGQEWTFPAVAGIGAGVDSFYEYAFKWYVISGMTLLLLRRF